MISEFNMHYLLHNYITLPFLGIASNTSASQKYHGKASTAIFGDNLWKLSCRNSVHDTPSISPGIIFEVKPLFDTISKTISGIRAKKIRGYLRNHPRKSEEIQAQGIKDLEQILNINFYTSAK